MNSKENESVAQVLRKEEASRSQGEDCGPHARPCVSDSAVKPETAYPAPTPAGDQALTLKGSQWSITKPHLQPSTFPSV